MAGLIRRRPARAVIPASVVLLAGMVCRMGWIDGEKVTMIFITGFLCFATFAGLAFVAVMGFLVIRLLWLCLCLCHALWRARGVWLSRYCRWAW